MNNVYSAWLGAALALATSVSRADLRLSVSPGGEIRSPHAALEKIRRLRADGALKANEPASIALAAGVYRLDKPLAFGPDDSFVSLEGEKGVVISGGEELPRFTAGPDGIWRTKVPRGLVFEQLWINGRRAVRAKTPNNFYLYIRKPIYECEDPYTGKVMSLHRRAFIGQPEDLRAVADLPHDELTNAVARIYYGWDTDWLHFYHVDAASGRVIFQPSAGRNFFQWPTYCTRYQVENFRSALDAPGEWFLDTKAGELLYIPLPGETVENVHAEVPRVEKWLTLTGDRAKGRLVRNVSFRNIAFSVSGYRLPRSLFTCQGAFMVDAAVEARGAENLVFEDCRFEHTGGYGLWLAKGTRHAEVRRCRLRELGGGGIRIGDRGWTKDEQEHPELLTGFVTVDNCIVSDGGKQFPAGIGVVITHAADCRITHNEICNFYYTGISQGWTWGYAPTVTRRNLIAYNHVHHLGLGVLGDMGGIYTLGDSRGTRIIGNVIHDVLSYDKTGGGSCGIYTDEGSRGIFCASNVIWYTNTKGINQNYGKENVFADNVIVEPVRMRGSNADSESVPLPGTPFAMSLNGRAVTVHHYDPPFAAAFSNNIIYASGRNPVFTRGAGMDTNRWDDVIRIGNMTRPIADFSPPGRGHSGVYGDPAWIAEADSVKPLPVEDQPMPPLCEGLTSFETGFEALNAGATLPDVFARQLSGNDYGHMRVTAKVAASGEKSFEMFDSPTLKYDHLPHFGRHAVNATNGLLELHFSLRIEPGVRVQLECRDTNPSERADRNRFYAIATRLNFASGKVTAAIGGHAALPVCDYKPDTWIRCRMTASSLGTDRGRYAYSATGEDGVEHRIEGAVYESQAKGIGWFGFLTPGKSGGRWYVDDIGWNIVAGEDPARYWNLGELSAPPPFRPCPAPESAFEDLRPLLVKGRGPEKTEAEFFCYYGVPKGARPPSGWPGVVLVHGGGGTAYPQYAKMWRDCGFAVIAPDWYNRRPAPGLTNEAPTQVNVPRVDLPGGKRQDHVANVANLILAHSLLRSFPEVDAARTCYVGLSWGSWYGTCVAAVDDRFKGCVEIYCGDYDRSKDGAYYSLVNGRFLPMAKVPMWWTVSTNDRNVKPETSNAGFAACADFAGVALVNDLPHSHIGFEFDSVQRMARHFTGSAKSLPRFGVPRVRDGVVSADIVDDGNGVTEVLLCYTTSDEMPTWKRKWSKIAATRSGSTVSAVLPKGAVQCYLAACERDSRFSDLRGTTHFIDIPRK